MLNLYLESIVCVWLNVVLSWVSEWFWFNQSLLFLLNAVWLAEKQQIPISLSLAEPDRVSNPWSTALEPITLTFDAVCVVVGAKLNINIFS
jgi:hypothetical protein